MASQFAIPSHRTIRTHDYLGKNTDTTVDGGIITKYEPYDVSVLIEKEMANVYLDCVNSAGYGTFKESFLNKTGIQLYIQNINKIGVNGYTGSSTWCISTGLAVRSSTPYLTSKISLSNMLVGIMNSCDMLYFHCPEITDTQYTYINLIFKCLYRPIAIESLKEKLSAVEEPIATLQFLDIIHPVFHLHAPDDIDDDIDE